MRTSPQPRPRASSTSLAASQFCGIHPSPVPAQPGLIWWRLTPSDCFTIVRLTMHDSSPEVNLRMVAEQVVRARGFDPQFSPAVQKQILQIQLRPPVVAPPPPVRDLRGLLLFSKDDDDSRHPDENQVGRSI